MPKEKETEVPKYSSSHYFQKSDKSQDIYDLWFKDMNLTSVYKSEIFFLLVACIIQNIFKFECWLDNAFKDLFSIYQT